MNTYFKQQEANIGEAQQDFIANQEVTNKTGLQIKELHRELLRMQTVLQAKGFIPTLEVAIDQLQDLIDEEDTDALMDDDSDEVDEIPDDLPEYDNN